ncbi:MAG: thiol reductant ABC exporter subunit CydC [Actinomycetota bacterium]|nr:thiol reductant ABC exporter subunit CydC [Actinomycetota bacterium]
MSALRWMLRLGRTGRGRLALAIALGALASGAAVGLAATSAWLISRASQHPPVLHLMVAIVAVRTFGLARGVLRYGERVTGHDASFRTLADLRVATVERLEQVLPIRSGDSARRPLTTSDLLARFVSDVDSLQDLWVRVVLPYASSALVGAGAIALVTVLAPAAGVALAVTLVIAAVVAPAVAIRAAKGADARLAPLRAHYQARVLDLLAGATELSVYGALPDRLAQLDRHDAAMTKAQARSSLAAGYGAAVAALVAGVAMWCGLWFGAAAVDTGALAAVSLAVVVLASMAVHEVFTGLAPAARELPALAGAAARVREVFEQPASTREPDAPLQRPDGALGLRVRNLHARWSPAGPGILRGLDLDLPAGAHAVIVGPSGCGKSTLAAVLLRLLDPTEGSVELVGAESTTSIAQLSGDDVRQLVGWCAQDAYIFDSTIEANLRLARPAATDAELADALRRARLDEWVATLPHGLDTMVGEHGGSLSGGQRQRVALARTLLADRPIVVFDEPTEHLDEATAAELAADITNAARGRTVIVVTHRPDLFPTVSTRFALVDGRLARE